MKDFFTKNAPIGPLLWGPLFLLCTLTIAAKQAFAWDLLAIGIIGLILCLRYQIRGCAYALALLGLTTIIQHGFFVSDHLWQLCIESSLACGFLITAFTAELSLASFTSLQEQVETQKGTIQNIEDDASKNRLESQVVHIALQEKHALLQKEFEELQAEHSALLILNEVLRKTTAKHLLENERLTALASVEKPSPPLETHPMDALYKQLKKQFEEKTATLASTRTELFHKDAELQTLKIEKQAKEIEPLPSDIAEELYRLSRDLQSKEFENEQLTELVTFLSQDSDPATRAKKPKPPTTNAQELLF